MEDVIEKLLLDSLVEYYEVKTTEEAIGILFCHIYNKSKIINRDSVMKYWIEPWGILSMQSIKEKEKIDYSILQIIENLIFQYYTMSNQVVIDILDAFKKLNQYQRKQWIRKNTPNKSPYIEGFIINPKNFKIKEEGDKYKEIDLEKYLCEYPDVNIIPGVKIIARQFPVYSGFVDLLGEDINGNKVIIELKITNKPKEVLAQLLLYKENIEEKYQESARILTILPKSANVSLVELFIKNNIEVYYYEYINGKFIVQKTPRTKGL